MSTRGSRRTSVRSTAHRSAGETNDKRWRNLRGWQVDLFVVAATTVVLLVWLARPVDFSHLHVIDILNDQVGYVTAARNWLANGRCESTTIYPALVERQGRRNFMHLPGHCACLAASYALFGYGVLSSMLPNIASLAVAVAGVFLAARRLYGRSAAYLAAAIFCASPFNQALVYTAMAELTFVAAAAVAIVAFLWCPLRLRPLVGAVVLVLPFVFRETGSLLVLLFAGIMWYEPKRSLGRLATLFALSVAMLSAIYLSPMSRERSSMAAANFLENGPAQYNDAVASARLRLTPGEIVARLPGRMYGQLRALVREARPRVVPAYVLLFAYLAAIPMGLAYGLKARDGWALGTAALVGVLVPLLAAFYTCAGWTCQRMLMFAFLPVSVLFGQLAARALERCSSGTWRGVAVGLTAMAWMTVSAANADYLTGLNRWLTRMTGEAERCGAALDALARPGEGDLVVGEGEIIFQYQLGHFPTLCALKPFNLESFIILNRHYPVPAIMAKENEQLDSDLASLGYEKRDRVTRNGPPIGIYLPAAPSASAAKRKD